MIPILPFSSFFYDACPFFIFLGCVFFGWVLGIFSGMIPGVHVNNISVLLVAFSSFFYELGADTFHIASVIIGCAVSHTFHDILPTIFFGAPGSDTALAVLPGHRLLMSGLGPFSVRLSALASFGSVVFSVFFILPLCLFFYFFYRSLFPFISFFLFFVSVLVILSADGF